MPRHKVILAWLKHFDHHGRVDYYIYYCAECREVVEQRMDKKYHHVWE